MHKNSLLLLATSVFCLTFTLLLGFRLTFTLLPGFTTFTPVYFFYPLKSLLLLLLLLLCRTFTPVYFFGGLSTFTFTSVTFFKIIKLYFLLQSILFPISGRVSIDQRCIHAMSTVNVDTAVVNGADGGYNGRSV